jgi:hypothetical protein|tara:strand:+ start:131 stop:286 length:156 start_codon:yes stop_codon:yes gene_type:complete
MTKQEAEKLGWAFSPCETTVEKGHEIYMLPTKEMALAMVAKREAYTKVPVT